MKKSIQKHLKLLIAVIAIAGWSHELNAQCSINASADTTVCIFGSSVQLNATSSSTPIGYSWSPSTRLSNTTISNPVATVNGTIKYYVTASFANGTELVTNGNFESGNTGFSSDYAFNPTPVPYSNNLDEEEYYVGTNPSAIHQCFAACTDHTSGVGKMMIINGAPTANVKIWKQIISVTPNTDYAFSAWLNNVTCGVGYNAQLQFSIGGNLVGGTFESDSALCSWKKFFQIWNSGSNTSVEISIVNQNTDPNGNDFALDDISFRSICYATDSVSITFSPKMFTQNLVLCNEEDSVQLPSEIWVDTIGTFYDTLQAGNGCDSIITTNVTLFNPIELVENGDFEDGDTAFDSDYTYNPYTTPYTSNLLESQYDVGTNPSSTHQCFASCSDHTSGSGNMMIINGAPTANVKVWKQTVSVQPNRYYEFSAWINNITCGVGYNAILQFSIGGVLIGDTIESDSALCSWKQFYQVWNSGSNTSVEISIVNQNTNANGNDFALDDISFKEICPSDTNGLGSYKTGNHSLRIEESRYNNKLIIYPNPTKSDIFIQAKEPLKGGYIIKVYESTGRIVLSKQFMTTNAEIINVPVDELSEGTYIINISNIDNTINENHKIILIK